MKFFVSYSRTVQEEVRKVVDLLRAGGHEVWWDADIPVMADWWAVILDKIEWCEIFIFVTSEKSVESPYCIAELKYANDRQRPILPFMLEDPTTLTLPPQLPARTQWLIYEGNLAKMLEQIKLACKNINLEQYPDRKRQRPPEPLIGGKNIPQLFDNAHHLANAKCFEDALDAFRNIQKIDYDHWGHECDYWIDCISSYMEIAELAEYNTTRNKAREAWRRHVNQFRKDFDPNQIDQRFLQQEKPDSSRLQWILRVLCFLFGIILGFLIFVVLMPFLPPEPTPETLEQALARAQNFTGTNEAWRPFSYYFEDGIEMVLVPVGCFQMGNDGHAGYWNTVDSWENGIPDGGHICFERPFWIDMTELSQANFERLDGQLDGTVAFSGDANLPVEQITWFEAKAFCEARGARLPTEAEWEYAARGVDSFDFPWGDAFDGELTNFCDSNCSETWANKTIDDGYQFTSPIGTYPLGSSWIGALDMAGNVWEWTTTIYRDYPYNANDGREANTGENTNVRRVLRGGSWYFYAEYLRSASRDNNLPNSRGSNNGFRCARTAFLSPISDLFSYLPVNHMVNDLTGSDFEWLSSSPEQTASPSLLDTEMGNIRGTFVYWPIELRSTRNQDGYSSGTVEARLQRELRDAEREDFDDLIASIYIETEHTQDIYVIPYITVDGIGTIPLGFGEVIPSNRWRLITWREVIDSTLYNDGFVAELQALYTDYDISDLGFIRLTHILNVNMQDGTNIGFRFKLISDADVDQEDKLLANIYISSLTFPP